MPDFTVFTIDDAVRYRKLEAFFHAIQEIALMNEERGVSLSEIQAMVKEVEGSDNSN